MSEPIWRFRRENEIAPEGSMLTNMGWLVPVERCEHSNIDPHATTVSALGLPKRYRKNYWCLGAGVGGDDGR